MAYGMKYTKGGFPFKEEKEHFLEKEKGMSTFDFDDTLTSGKSGINYGKVIGTSLGCVKCENGKKECVC